MVPFAMGMLDALRDAKSLSVLARVLMGWLVGGFAVSGLAFGSAFGGWVGGWPSLVAGGLAFGRTCLVLLAGGGATCLVLSIAAQFATRGVKRLRLARVAGLQQRAYGVATVVWALALAIVGTGVCCLCCVAVQRAFLCRGMSLVDALHLPQALGDVAYSVVSIGFWPVMVAGAMLVRLGCRLPPID
ncbi:MAG: hypothetical protein KAI24_22590 [Planctomycetes bacterium]|nr:hypothetical protein [Planctomycetota bacterium]